jgi:acetolactate synthase I/II/III large subunit
MRVADYIFSRLADEGLRHVFMVTGGGAMFLNDAVRRETRLGWTCHHHEQAAAMAAEGYARIAGVPAILNVTTGPGGINALNGVFGAWTDSIPMFVISGQVKRETCMSTYPGLGLRQLGDQETDIISFARDVTKLAVQIVDPSQVRRTLEEALWLATQGRQGPVWLDVPIDVQSTDVEPDRLEGFTPPSADPAPSEMLTAAVADVVDRIEAAERPVVLAGTGIRLAGAQDALLRVADVLGVPLTTAWTHDLVPNDHPLWCGRPGTIGDRAGNYAVQASDVLLVIGSRLNIRQVSYNWQAFAPHAYKIQVDIDPAELAKPTVRPDLAVCSDARVFLEALEGELIRRRFMPGRHTQWLDWCKERTRRYRVAQGHERAAPPIDPYQFVDVLFRLAGSEDVVVTGNGAACVMTFQAANLKAGQRLFSNSGSASMGYDLPAALGAAVALAERTGESGRADGAGGGRPQVICLAGDGSIQMNIQELQTLATHRWPVKVFVIDNGGYLSIRSSQDNFFEGRIGESPDSGVGLPDWVAVAEAYGIDAVRVTHPRDMVDEIAAALAAEGPRVVHVVVDPDQGFEPRVKSRQLPDGRIESPALDDLFPFLPPEEAAANRLRGDGTLP